MLIKHILFPIILCHLMKSTLGCLPIFLPSGQWKKRHLLLLSMESPGIGYSVYSLPDIHWLLILKIAAVCLGVWSVKTGFPLRENNSTLINKFLENVSISLFFSSKTWRLFGAVVHQGPQQWKVSNTGESWWKFDSLSANCQPNLCMLKMK